MAYTHDRIAEFISAFNAELPDGHVYGVARTRFGPPITLQQLRAAMQKEHRHIDSMVVSERGVMEIQSCDEQGEDRTVEYWMLVVMGAVEGE